MNLLKHINNSFESKKTQNESQNVSAKQNSVETNISFFPFSVTIFHRLNVGRKK